MLRRSVTCVGDLDIVRRNADRRKDEPVPGFISIENWAAIHVKNCTETEFWLLRCQASLAGKAFDRAVSFSAWLTSSPSNSSS